MKKCGLIFYYFIFWINYFILILNVLVYNHHKNDLLIKTIKIRKIMKIRN